MALGIKTDKLTMQSECYFCKHRRTIGGDAHTRCSKPDPDMTGHEWGASQGWYNYPHNFDPCWKTKDCANFSPQADLTPTHDSTD